MSDTLSHSVVSESTDGKRRMVVFTSREGGKTKSFTQHQVKEAGEWRHKPEQYTVLSPWPDSKNFLRP